MARFIRALVVSGLWLAYAAQASAEGFSLRYEADGTFPEAEAWVRDSGNEPDGRVIRLVEDGIFRIDSTESFDWDIYKLENPALVPGPGELLRVDWRTRVLEQGGTDVADWFGEAGMYIRVNGSASFHLAPDSISVMMGEYPDYQVRPLEAGVWHVYSFLTDAQHYDLFVDGQLAFQSNVRSSETPYPAILWGDTWSGGTGGSVSEWDYVHVSIVPEPGAIMIGIVAFVIVFRTTRKGM